VLHSDVRDVRLHELLCRAPPTDGLDRYLAFKNDDCLAADKHMVIDQLHSMNPTVAMIERTLSWFSLIFATNISRETCEYRPAGHWTLVCAAPGPKIPRMKIISIAAGSRCDNYAVDRTVGPIKSRKIRLQAGKIGGAAISKAKSWFLRFSSLYPAFRFALLPNAARSAGEASAGCVS
jgi:hypothetical protein